MNSRSRSQPVGSRGSEGVAQFERDGDLTRFAPAARAANTVILPILSPRAHPVLSGRLVLLEYVTGTTGHRHTVPFGYFPWDGNDVLAAAARRRSTFDTPVACACTSEGVGLRQSRR